MLLRGGATRTVTPSRLSIWLSILNLAVNSQSCCRFSIWLSILNLAVDSQSGCQFWCSDACIVCLLWLGVHSYSSTPNEEQEEQDKAFMHTGDRLPLLCPRTALSQYSCLAAEYLYCARCFVGLFAVNSVCYLL